MDEANAAEVTITVRWTMTLDDLINTRRMLTRSVARTVGVMGLAAVAYSLVQAVSGPDAPSASWLAYSLLTLGTLALVASRPFQRFVIRRSVSALVGSACECTAAASGLAYRQAGATGVIEWSALTGVREDARTLLVMSGRSPRFSIPKRAFATSAETRAFRDQVLRFIAQGRRAAPPA
jgi:hypothetical protein